MKFNIKYKLLQTLNIRKDGLREPVFHYNFKIVMYNNNI